MEDKSLFFNYFTAGYVANKLNIDPDELTLRAMQKQVNFYYPVKSTKIMHFIPRSSLKKPSVLFLYLVWGKISAKWLSKKTVIKGSMVCLNLPKHLDLLGKNILDEKDIFFLDKQNNTLLLDWFIKTRNNFSSINFADIYILPQDAQLLLKLINDELDETGKEALSRDEVTLSKKETKQTAREKVFLAWLHDKDEADVVNMKKEDVLMDLRMIDPHLFMGNQKHFFRIQKIIEFKSGRKPITES